MTPRRYLSTANLSGLTIDRRDHASMTETQQDEIQALRKAWQELKAENETLHLQNAELAELVKVRDEQIAAWNDEH
jgi:hypothetical protein